MNKLKKLFSPSTLAATAATALLLGSAIAAFANGEDLSESAASSFNGCASGYHECSAHDADYFNVELYWCCPNPPAYYCGSNSQGTPGNFIGWCSLTP
jgi:hypothetical protein